MQWKINYYRNQNNISPIEKWLDSIDNEPKAEIFKIFQTKKTKVFFGVESEKTTAYFSHFFFLVGI